MNRHSQAQQHGADYLLYLLIKTIVTLNVRANPIVEAQVGALRGKYTVYELQDVEIERYWPALVQLWPAYQQHYERSGSRSVFVLAPL